MAKPLTWGPLLRSAFRQFPPAVWAYRLAVRRARLRSFRKAFRRFKHLADDAPHRFEVAWGNRKPCLDDSTGTTVFDRHYIYHTAWAARVLAETRPVCHVDVASTLYFCGIVSAFIPVRFYDYRPADLRLTHLTSESADLLALPFGDDSIASLSCMHVVEHVGLGRYGDPLNAEGDVRAMNELRRVLAPGGNLLFVVPVGRPQIQFNAHRIYSYQQVLDGFTGLTLKEFSLIPEHEDAGGLIRNAPPAAVQGEKYACGCFWFSKPA